MSAALCLAGAVVAGCAAAKEPVAAPREEDRLVGTELTAEGNAVEICSVVVEVVTNSYDGVRPTVLADEVRADGRWLFCEGEPGVFGVAAAHSGDGQTWTAADLGLSRWHSGDDLDIHVADAVRAWVTMDSLVGESQLHVATRDGGSTWQRIRIGSES